MRLLLDTSVVLWCLSGSPRLGRKARRAIASADSEVWVSAASAWEIAIKAAAGRPLYRESPEKWLLAELERNRFRPLSITAEHALAVTTLPQHHSDPFDRMIIAQSRIEGLKLVSADTNFEAYDVDLIDATA